MTRVTTAQRVTLATFAPAILGQLPSWYFREPWAEERVCDLQAVGMSFLKMRLLVQSSTPATHPTCWILRCRIQSTDTIDHTTSRQGHCYLHRDSIHTLQKDCFVEPLQSPSRDKCIDH